jgi:hypothetical protein
MRSAPQPSSPLSPCLSGASGFLNVPSRRPRCSHSQFPPYNPEAFNTFPFNFLPPLCPLLATPILCFQSLTASFHKTPGVGYPPAVDFDFRVSVFDSLPLCFHNLTNPFSRNSFVLTSIQNPRGCGRRTFPKHSKSLVPQRRDTGVKVPYFIGVQAVRSLQRNFCAAPEAWKARIRAPMRTPLPRCSRAAIGSQLVKNAMPLSH